MNVVIIDAHTHIFPDKIAPKVLAMNEEEIGLKAYGTGSLDGLMSYMNEAGVAFAAVLGVAPSARLVKATNDWLLGLANPRIIVFGTITPDYENWNDEIRRLKFGGAKGIKINSLLQHIVPDDPLMYPIYEKLAEEGMFTFFHSGRGEGKNSQVPVRSTPKQLRKVHDDFPELKMIIAHFGGYGMLNEAKEYLIGQDVFLDTSYCPTIRGLNSEKIVDLVRSHSAEHILYGTDYPWGKQGPPREWEYSFIQKLPLSDREKEMILGRNALTLFNF